MNESANESTTEWPKELEQIIPSSNTTSDSDEIKKQPAVQKFEKYEECYKLLRDNWGLRTGAELFPADMEFMVKKYCRTAHIEEHKD